MGGTAQWRQYQRDVADLLSELGFETEVEAKIKSIGGVTHEIDVAARRTVAGVPILWVVECKLWRSRVGKEKVAALAAICDDLGCDRGLLMSETGFQSGALKMSVGRSITLSNLEDARANAMADLCLTRRNRVEHRMRRLTAAIDMRHPRGSITAGDVLRYLYNRCSDEIKASCEANRTALTYSNQSEFERLIDEALGYSALSEGRSHYGEILEGVLSQPQGPIMDVYGRRAPMSMTELLDILDGTRKIIDNITIAINRGCSGHWPVTLMDANHTGHIAFNLDQLLGVIELMVTDCEEACAVELYEYSAFGEKTD